MVERTCAACGEVFQLPHKIGRPSSYCSDECRSAVRGASAKARRRADRPPTTCDVCFGLVPFGRAKRCSPECAAEALRHRSCGWPVNACPLHVRTCADCGGAFILRQATGAQRRRCEACQIPEVDRLRARRAARRNAVAAGEVVRLADVAARDGYRCQLCRRKVDMALPHPDPLSPSLDHIVPLSEGGKHAMTNVQLAHLRCNMMKGARPAGEQLRLVG